MKIINELTLAAFRMAGCCECCSRSCPNSRDAHHIHTRGSGRLDLRINLASLCRSCHQDAHAGVITRFDLWTIVAAREDVSQDDIIETINFLLRLPKAPRQDQIAAAMKGMPGTARELAKQILVEEGA